MSHGRSWMERAGRTLRAIVRRAIMDRGFPLHRERRPEAAAEPTPADDRGVWRVEVRPAHADDDPAGRDVRREAASLGLVHELSTVRTARVYLVEAAFDRATAQRLAEELLADPVTERVVVGAAPIRDDAPCVEVHYRPGVMDPVAESARGAVRDMLDAANDGAPAEGSAEIDVRTGFRYDLVGAGREEAERIARGLLANPVIQWATFAPYHPFRFPKPSAYRLEVQRVPIRGLDADALARLSREAHLFLSPDEMRTIQRHYEELGREPTDVELETLAQTWSEHCVHKTFKSTIRYRERSAGSGGSQVPASTARRDGTPSPSLREPTDRPGHRVESDDGEPVVVIDNLLRSTVVAATERLRADGLDWCLSVFVDNAGVVAFDDAFGVSFKVETHNHPSAIEPYGGAATGIGGCIRDTMGTGLLAKPVASTDVFCLADPSSPAHTLPRGAGHPRRMFEQVVAGVRDYGNRMGIPTVDGAVAFDPRYLGNPLVFCGSVGLIPRDKCFGEPQAGDRIVVVGGRTGRDGIHGATFSSAELTGGHADEFSHAVQIGNPVTEKKVLDVLLRARDGGTDAPATAPGSGEALFHAITDCGAGGFSSAVGEMGRSLGASVQLERAPLKYEGLSYTEVWISEAQERMVLAVPPENLDALRTLCEEEDVEMADLGAFGAEGRRLHLSWGETEVGRLSMDFLHDGLPRPEREATWHAAAHEATPPPPLSSDPDAPPTGDADVGRCLLALLRHPNIASKHWVVQQYDHEVQGGSAVKPMMGRHADVPSDASVLRPRLDSDRAVVMSCGLSTSLGDADPYWMALAAIDEAIRNAICVGARSDRIALLDNFCWPSCDETENLGGLVRAAAACYDGAMAYRTPFISGKDSLNNQFTDEQGHTIAIPPTLLISAVGLLDDVRSTVTMDAKASGDLLVQVGLTTPEMGGAHLLGVTDATGRLATGDIPRVDLDRTPAGLAAVSGLIRDGRVRAAHDCSEGGLLVAAAEMAFAGGVGLGLDLRGVPQDRPLDDLAAAFAETPGRVLLEVREEDFDPVARALRAADAPFGQVGRFDDGDRFTVRGGGAEPLCDLGLSELRRAWRTPLDW